MRWKLKEEKIIKHIERMHLEVPISDQQYSKTEIQKIVLIKLCSNYAVKNAEVKQEKFQEMKKTCVLMCFKL